MPHSRPYILPFTKAHRIGLPYHGLVRDGLLQLPDSSTKQWVSGSDSWDSATVAVRHPRASVSVDVDANDQETANRTWQNYALLSSFDRIIGGDSLGDDRWLYCDAERTWVVSYALTGTTTSATLTIYLQQRFGVFGAESDGLAAPINIGSLTFQSKGYDGSAVPSPINVYARPSHSLDGSKTAFNIYSNGTVANNTWPYTGFATYLAGVYDGPDFVHEIITVEISGNGDDEGSGISAAVVMYQTAEDMAITNNGPTDHHFKSICAMTNDGAIVQGELAYSYTVDSEIIGYDPPGYGIRETTHTLYSMVSYGGQTLEINGSFTYLFYSSGSVYEWVEGSINGEEMVDPGNQQPDSMSASKSLFFSSYSVDIGVPRTAASGNGASVVLISAVGKEGHTAAVADDWDGTQDITYDSVRGLITVGDVGERVVYV